MTAPSSFRSTDAQVATDTTAAIIAMTDGERQHVREAVESVLSQTRRPEVVRVYVADDNGWIDDALTGLAGVEVRRMPLHPTGEIRNAVARDADTTWIAYLDGDDVWLPTKHARQLFCARSGAELVGCDYSLMNSEGGTHVAALCRAIPSPSSWLVRRSTMLEKPFSSNEQHEDAHWWEAHRAWTFTVRVPDRLHRLRVRTASRSTGTPGKRHKMLVMRWAGLPGFGALVRLAATTTHRFFRADRYTVPAAFRSSR